MMRLRRRLAGAALAALLLVGAAGCTTNPATGEREFTPFLSPAQERQAGEQQHPAVLAQFGGAYEDPELQAYVERIGQRLAEVSELPEQDFTFTVLNTDVINALALPGGYVYVTRGLVALADSEAELAGVLGHEIGHVTARHAAQRTTRSVFGQLGQAALTVLGGVLAGQAGAELGSAVGGVGGSAYAQSYSRDQEFEADDLGVRYLVRAGYDPAAMAGFLRTMNRQSELERQLAGGGGGEDPGLSWFASHPRTLDRVERVVAEVEEAMAGEQGRVGREEFLEAIDGLVFGEDPAQGLLRGRTFIHPELRFAFEAPEGFRLQNLPQAVIGQGPGGRVMIFDAAPVAPGRGVEAYLARDWARGASPRQVQTFEVNGMEAAGALVDVQIGGRPAVALLVAIRHGADRVYRFVFASQGGIGRGELAAYNAAIGSFRRLGAEEAAEIRPRRIEIVTVRPGETVEALARRMAVDELPRERFLVLNNLEPGDELEPGRRVKIVTEG